ncbi:pyridine nucleotide-disulfide oxidoreductase [Dictyocaulus viviparus]|uniref:Pyridine nucleotide-disulfide oxidoreductase n=1 Tax=Dictyocaulus viviparus TaxID=29172 RepID=A0A0D8XWF2_DICVI|nr:pyridine nucleotide-disulfide oxidoreductase [Dictyocaulus viviparus]
MRRGGPHHHGAPIPTSLGLAFPTCVAEALIQVSKHVRLSSHGRSRPTLIKNNDLQLLIDNEIFCLNADRKSSRLSELQEFNLINHLAHFFTERDEINKYAYFEVLFLGREGESYVHDHRLRLLYRLASYALQYPVLQLYAQISLWLSKVGNSKTYAEELVAVLTEHYLKPSDSSIYEYLLPLETSCPEFTVFFVVYATRFLSINRPMAAVFSSYINRNPGYFLKGFRDSPHLADVFRLEVFQKMLTYLLEMEGDPSSDQEATNYHTAVMVLLENWNNNIKKPLDISLLFDPSVRWSRFRCDALCVVSSKSPAACKFVSAKLEGSKIPPTWYLDLEPVYVPKPAVGERNWLGSLKKPGEKYPHEPYKITKSSVYVFLGAGCGVFLTLLVVTFYTNIFGRNIMKDRKSQQVANSVTSFVYFRKFKRLNGVVCLYLRLFFNQPDTIFIVMCDGFLCVAFSVQKEEVSALKHPHQVVGSDVISQSKQSQTIEPSVTTYSQTVKPVSSSSPISEQMKESDNSHEKDRSRQNLEIAGDRSHEELERYSSQHAKKKFPVASEQDKSDHDISFTSSLGEEVPKFVEYLLIGAGAAAYYASLAIRARQADAKVLMVGEENHLPYNRPPLSKELWWFGDHRSSDTLQYIGVNGRKRDVFFETAGFFVPPSELSSTIHGGVSLLKGRRVLRLCPNEKKAYLDDGSSILYDKCLIATGGKPKVLPELEKAPREVKERILYLRDVGLIYFFLSAYCHVCLNLFEVDDYRKLEEICRSSKSISIVGGGFLGSELAYSINRKYKDIQITQVVAENGNLSGVLPEFLSKKATEAIRGIGVDVMTNAKITAARKKDENIELEVNGSQYIVSDFTVITVGMQPDTSVAEASGFEIDNRLGGIATDAELRVRSNIWAAGDAASFYDKTLGRRRIEHWENAQISGRLAGENMTGAGKAFWYQPAFYSKIAPQWHINAVGVTDSSLPTVSAFAVDNNANNEHHRGVVFYKGDHNKVVGVLLLNVFGSSIDVARRLIDDGRSIEDFQQLVKLFPLYKPDDTKEESK